MLSNNIDISTESKWRFHLHRILNEYFNININTLTKKDFEYKKILVFNQISKILHKTLYGYS